MNNANAVWVTLLAPTESIESTFLLPSLDREMHTFPLDRYSAAQVTVSGEMTLASITVDLALQALGTAVDLIPGGSCLIPEEQLAYTAASFAYILAPAARLIWEGDLDGAWEELQQLLPQFLERCGGVLKGVVSDCVSEGLEKLLGNPFVIAKLAGECIIWSAKAIWDYFDYQGRPVYATLVYEIPVAIEPTVTPSPSATPVAAGPGCIVFVSYRDNNLDELYLMDGDGRNQRRLTTTPDIQEWHPAWSPDGSRIVFQCYHSGGPGFNVCLINPDGSGYTEITNWEQDGSGAQRPVWSPDGNQIAVSRETDGSTWIWLMNADGSNQRQLVEGRDPSWSPDGTRIAFEGQMNGGYSQLFTVNADGSDLRQLTELPNFVMYPTWSPDGRQIAFEVGMAYIAVIDAEGGEVRTVVDKRSWNLSWSPDGTQLVLAPVQDGIWVVNLDGSGLHQIAHEGTQPSWHR
jgi:hypothetical protein